MFLLGNIHFLDKMKNNNSSITSNKRTLGTNMKIKVQFKGEFTIKPKQNG